MQTVLHMGFPHIQAKTNGDTAPFKLRIPDNIMPSVLCEFDKTDRNRYLSDTDVPCAQFFILLQLIVLEMYIHVMPFSSK